MRAGRECSRHSGSLLSLRRQRRRRRLTRSHPPPGSPKCRRSEDALNVNARVSFAPSWCSTAQPLLESGPRGAPVAQWWMQREAPLGSASGGSSQTTRNKRSARVLRPHLGQPPRPSAAPVHPQIRNAKVLSATNHPHRTPPRCAHRSSTARKTLSWPPGTYPGLHVPGAAGGRLHAGCTRRDPGALETSIQPVRARVWRARTSRSDARPNLSHSSLASVRPLQFKIRFNTFRKAVA